MLRHGGQGRGAAGRLTRVAGRVIARAGGLARGAALALALLLVAASAAAPARAQLPPAAARDTASQWEGDIRAFEAQDRASPPPRHGILFVGSSSIRFWDSLASDFPGVPLIQRGFGGSELGDVLHFVDRIVIPYEPRTIVLYAGDNDIANGKAPEDVEATYRAFVARVEAALPGTRIVFVSIKPSPSRWALADRMREANARIERLTTADARLSYVDVFGPMLGANGRPRPELFRDDSLHMTPGGYGVWVRALRPYVH